MRTLRRVGEGGATRFERRGLDAARVSGVAASLLASLLASSCGGDDRSSDAGVDAAAARVDAAQRDASAPAGCPDAPVLGAATEVERFTVPFTWEDGWWVGRPLTVAVPSDLTGLTIAVVAGAAETGLDRVLLDERVLLDVTRDDPDLTATVGPFFHVPVPAGAVAFPMDPASSLSAGCLTVRPAALADVGEAEVVFVSRRRPLGGALDVNAIVVGDTIIEEGDIEAAFAVAGAVYAGAGDLAIGEVALHALDAPSAFVGEAATGALRARFRGADTGRMNVYFIQDFLEPGTLGTAAGVPGPNGLHGTVGSGLVVSVDSHLDAEGALDVTTLGETLAHEIGHQLGLFHTTESDGFEHDGLVDTPRCDVSRDADADGSMAAEECVGAGGENVMFWTSGDLRQAALTASQLDVLRASVVVR